MLARFSVSTFSIPAQAVYSQPSDSTPASFPGMVNSSSHSSTPMPSTVGQLVRFADFEVDLRAGQLRRKGAKIRLQEQPFRLLAALLESPGEMVTREDLRSRLWPADTFVDFDHRLAAAVSKLREALADSAENPQFVETMGRRGYRLMVPVQSVDRVPVNGKAGSSEEQAPEAARNNIEARTSEHTAPPQTLLQSKNRRAIFTIFAFAVLIVAAAAVMRSHLFWPKVAQRVKPRSLAILPLQNLDQDPDNDFLGFSLADAVITKLNYVSALTVRPSTAVEKYRGKVIDIQSVAADLKVDTLLTGSFIRDGNDLRITYQLIDVKTEKILGGGTINLKYDNLLRVHDDVAEEIVAKLELNLSPSEAAQIKPEASISPVAYEYYLRGVDFHSQHKFPMAIKMLEKSTEIDPNYALAWAYLGASYNSDAAFEFGGREQYGRAQAAYERALAMQPSQLDAQMFLANLFVDTGKVEQAVSLLRNALKANGNYAPVHWELGYAYRFAGMLNESIAECERARQLDPLVKSNGSVLNTYLYVGEYDKFLHSLPDVNDSSFLLFYRGFGEYYENDFKGASKDFDRAYEVDPTLYAQIGKALSSSIAHRKAAGLEILRGLESKITERGVGDPEAAYKVAQAFAVLGDKVSALRMLRRSVESGFFCYPYVATDPLLNGLRSEPELGQILEVARQRHEAFKASFF
jgi:DNA-binding winged helix-turn-helix (wHTH) protein/TolB-like protein/Tfp pilus assembly protein PilF